ncbi:hypothetical protein NQ315_005358 [Exocentrus adspersus]|uniref:RNA helicase n=1 Tax=Exocentrus adspersus TaxID=1586481 RepID=A0AAV8W2E9_9CUCU|nr:hypothetical protein NQ315_005358 [Exocentrus adspersus]
MLKSVAITVLRQKPEKKNAYLHTSNFGWAKYIKPSDLSAQNNKLEFVCIIKNIRKDNSMLLTSAMLLYPNELFSFTDSPSVTKLNAGASYTTTVKFNIGNVVIGSYKNTVAFSFQTSEAKEETFTIARSIIVSVEDPTPKPQTATKSPFTRSDWHETKIVVPPTKRLSMNEKHSIPANLYPILKLGLKEVDSLTPAMSDELSKLKEQLKPGYVTASNYQTFWHTMLWMEEISQVLMLKRFNMENVQIVVIGGQRLELEVPGLAEKRPSLIIGDLIDIRLHKNNKAYRGVIRVINDKTVYIDYVSYELVDSIRENPNIDLDVRFVLNRLPLERMHKAVDQVHFQHIPSVFPEKDRKQIQSELNSIRDTEFINESICTNHEQKTAVINIVNGTSGCSPYIVFGPPGTGKTVTIVEAILQLKNKTDKKILVCAPCNAACDMLTQKLMPHCTKKELIRVMSQTVDRRNLNPEILKYSNYLNRQFYTPPGKKLSDYRIVVTTLIHIGCYCGKYKPDVVFVDEAAQACEPEVSCALGMISKGNQIVLAGDPRQLGPCTASDIADKYGLGTVRLYSQVFHPMSRFLWISLETFLSNEINSVDGDRDYRELLCTRERHGRDMFEYLTKLQLKRSFNHWINIKDALSP